MSRTKIIMGLSSVALVGTACSVKEQQPQGPTNILFIMSDDHSFQTISAYDTRHIETPNIDRIANDGARFVNGFVANSISGPSRACMLTGKHSHKNGYTSNERSHFDGDQQTFPKLLQKVGYETAVIGKWHLTSAPQGFDYSDILIGQGEYYSPRFIVNGDTITRDGYATNVTTDIALDWFENKRDKDKPFCMLLHHKAPHRSWLPDVADLGMFDDKVFELPSNFHDDYQGREAAALQEMSISEWMDPALDLKLVDPEIKSRFALSTTLGMWDRMPADQRKIWDEYYAKRLAEYKELNLSGKELTEWKYQQYMKDYCTIIANLDRNIGRVLDYLEQHDMLDNTLVVYTSDQGFYMGEHGWYDKRFMYEESFRTPLVARLPGGKKGDIVQLSQNIDFAPTFLELAGVEIPSDIQGVSLLPLLKGEEPEQWRKSLYYHFYEFPGEHAVRRHYGVRTDRYKLIHFYNDIDSWELYDLETDPQEMNNLYGKPGTEELTKELKQELKALQVQYDQQM